MKGFLISGALLAVFLTFIATGARAETAGESVMISNELSFPAEFDRADFERLLRPEHPRLFASAERWREIRGAIDTSPKFRNLVAALETEAENILEAPPQERTMTGRRLLSVSREVLRRTFILGSLYRISGDNRYFDRAREELLAAAAFDDWNPSHFLDTAEMTLAVATGYDWLYEKFSEEDRATLRRAILEKGLEPGTRDHSWKRSNNNWNQVCFAGMVAGALAIGDSEPGLAAQFLRETFANIHRPLDACRPHGAYPEGPTYWSYGTHFQVILLAILESALGETWNLENYPAFQESAVYVNLMVGPSGLFYNYADGWERVSAMPALHWFASLAGNPALDARERDRLLESPSELARNAARNRFFPLSLLWLDPSLDAARAEPLPLPLHWRADGSNPVAVHRSSREPDAFYFGIKGGKPAVNHGHMDIGSFVLDWRGMRWATDLGAQGYESLESLGMRIWNRAQDGDRWRVFRLSNLSHNTLVIDDKLQRVDGFAPIVAFSENPAAPFTVVDMTKVYVGSLERAVRGARMLGPDRVLIADEIDGLAAGSELRWGMVTRAEVELNGPSAILRQGGETFHARIVSPENARFEIVPTDPPPNDFDTRNPGTRMLAFKIAGDGNPRELCVVLSADSVTDNEAAEILDLSPPGQ